MLNDYFKTHVEIYIIFTTYAKIKDFTMHAYFIKKKGKKKYFIGCDLTVIQRMCGESVLRMGGELTLYGRPRPSDESC